MQRVYNRYKKEISLVDSDIYSGSLRGTSAVFTERTKWYGKCLNSVYFGVKIYIWIYKKYIKII